MNSDFLNRSFEEVTGGQYDEEGFYRTPNGSFWDPDGIYFNKEGFDIHKGFYNSFKEYIPGPGWIEDLLCYEDEKEESILGNSSSNKKQQKRNEADEFYNKDDFADEDQLYEEIDYDKMLEEEEKKFSNLSIDVESIKIPAGKNNKCDINNIKKSGDMHSSTTIPTELLFSQIPPEKIEKLENKNYCDGNLSIDKKEISSLKHFDRSTDLNNKSRKEKQIEVDSLFS